MMIYLDYAATSKKREYLIKEIIENFDRFNGNPDSIHGYGREAKKILEESRDLIAKSIGASSKEIIFTSGASESNNTIIHNFANKGFIVTTKIEHPSILEPLREWAKQVVLIDADEDGLINLEKFSNAINDDTKLVSIILANNETGAIQPISQIRKIIGDRKIWLHLDAVQAYGHIDLDVEALGCDSMSLSGHKIGGLNGFGILYLRKRVDNLIFGGNQEKTRRAGTSFLMGAYTMAKSYNYMVDEREKIEGLKAYFIEQLNENRINYEINGNLGNQIGHILNIYFPFTKSKFLLTYLDMNGICVSAGSACTAGSLEPSHVIENMYDSQRAESSIRFSFGFENTKDEIDKVVYNLYQIQERMKNER